MWNLRLSRILLLLLIVSVLLPACTSTDGEELFNSPKAFDKDSNILSDVAFPYGPTIVEFEVGVFTQEQAGFLAYYTEQIGERTLSGAQIVAEISLLYSLNPKVLLTLLEYENKWVSDPSPVNQGEKPLVQSAAWGGGIVRAIVHSSQ